MAKTIKKNQTEPSKTNRKAKVKRSPAQKTRRVVFGLTLMILCVVVLIALVSHIFTGEADQVVAEGDKYANLIGRFGAWLSQVIMSRTGVAAFFIFTLGMMSGYNLMTARPQAKLILVALKFFITTVWLLLIFGFFPGFVLSGTWGNAINAYVFDNIGWGLYAALVVVPALWIVIHFRVTPAKIRLWRQQREAAKAARDAKPAEMAATQASVVNPLKQEQQEERPEDIFDGGVYHDGEAENDDPHEDQLQGMFRIEDHFGKEETGIHLAPQEDLEEQKIEEDLFDNSNVSDVSGDAEKEQGGELLEKKKEGGIEYTVTVAKKESEVEDDIARSLVEKYGEYDPTLDLPNFIPPKLEFLRSFDNEEITVDSSEVMSNRKRIVDTLKNYNIEISKISSTVGPTVTLYEIVPAPGVKISKIKNLEDDIALSLAALGIRIIAPIPGKGTIGIEVPNKEPNVVSMRSVVASKKFQACQMELPVAIGKTIMNETMVFDLAKAPHLLMAGATGQGKSVGLNAVITSLLYKKHPSQVKFVLVDPKKVELTLYNKIERHFLAKLPNSEEAIITDNTKVINTLNSLCIEMDNRYELLKDAMVRTIKEYNAKFIARKLNPEKGHRFLPYIVVVVDEFADLIMTAGKEVETPIARLAQLARAIGIHLIIATQRPSVNVITGVIKANFPMRVAFRVTSKIDSRTILDMQGADQLIGKGDMLLSMGNELVRIQCAFVDTPEVEEICDHIGMQRGYPDAFLLPEYEGSEESDSSLLDPNDRDPKFEEAARIVVTYQQGSTSFLQRRMQLGYNRAGRIVDQLESAGILGAFKGSKAREVLIADEASLNRMLGK